MPSRERRNALHSAPLSHEILITILLCLVCSLALPRTAFAAGEVRRLGGQTRYDTMAAISSEGFSSSEWAIIATGENYPDALVASPLAGTKSCPVILSAKGVLTKQAESELERLGVKNVLIMGDSSAVGEVVADAVRAKGIGIQRVHGQTRVETSIDGLAKVRENGSTSDTIIVCRGYDFADALSIGPWAYYSKSPIMLTKADGTLTDDAVSAIKADTFARRILIVGGSAAVSDQVRTQLGGAFEYVRLEGRDRYETSVNVATWATKNGLTWSHPAVATGSNYPDAISGAALCGSKRSPLLLVSNATSPAISKLKDSASDISLCYVLGGTNAISTTVQDSVASAIGVSSTGSSTYSSTYDPVYDYSTSRTTRPTRQVTERREYYTPSTPADSGESPSPEIPPTPVSKGDLKLTVDKTSVLVSDTKSQTFYATTSASPSSVTLRSSDLGTTYGEMYDDGNLDEHGDEIAGDGTYSMVLSSLPSADKALDFVAQSGEAVSNKEVVNYYVPFTPAQLATMEQIDTAIEQLVDGSGYWQKPQETRKAEAKALIDQLAASGLIDASSVRYDDQEGVFSFVDSMGIMSYIATKVHDHGIEGEAQAASLQQATPNKSASAGKTSNDPPVVGMSETLTDTEVGTAIVLNSFPSDSFNWETKASRSTYRTDFYRNLRSSWNSLGLETTLKDENVTVADYENLRGYDVACFSTHGTRLYVNTSTLKGTYSAIILGEKVTTAKNEKYTVELKDSQIVRDSGTYNILPRFFSKQYPNSALSNEFVFLECCQCMGDDPTGGNSQWDTTLADTIHACGAPSVVGYHNAAWADYSREFMDTCVKELVNGKNANNAYNAAVSKHGASKSGWMDKKIYSSGICTTYPRLVGDGTARIEGATVFDGIANGSFEETEMVNTILAPKQWMSQGDVRSLTHLGEIVPNATAGENMAMITTGVGSKTTASLDAGTEGSRISQRIRVPTGAKSITFEYNFVSEEPMEYVGSRFNDYFAVSTIHNKETQSQTLESINDSTWNEAKGIDFYGGDDTCYQTGWKSHTIDISQFKGDVIELQFTVYDRGDSVYDSAALIDNVRLT